MKKLLKYALVLLFGLGCQLGVNAQTDDAAKVQFNGLGRANILQTGIEGDVLEGDTTTPRNLTNGEFLLDLKMNATPNEKTEIQTILRLRNEFGGFFGAGATVEVRELWARGIIANAIKYRVGDMDLALSPYTLFSSEEEGVINQPSIFAPQQELIYYEQFYTGDNTRRLQGAQLEFGLDFNSFLRDMEVSGFITRIRGTDFFTIPSRFVSGGNLNFRTLPFNDSLGTALDLGVNFVHTFDDLKSGDANTGIRNTVLTLAGDLTIVESAKHGLHLMGEGGSSALKSLNDSTTFYESDDYFIDLGAAYELKSKKLKFKASYTNVGPEFFSMGAQSKKVDFTADKAYYNRLGNDQQKQAVNYFDLSRDPAIYTFQVSDRLMNYDPRFSNTLPYGKATPNRSGVNLGVDYGDKTEIVKAQVDASILSEIRGQGTEELRDFSLVRAAGQLNIAKILSWQNDLRFTLGYQFEQTQRGGTAVETINLTSNLIELGLEIELFADFELLFGYKGLMSDGTEYVAQINEFNIINDFPVKLDIDSQQQLLATGFRYNFKEGIYITAQYQNFSNSRGNTAPDYRLDQFFLLYTMNF